MGITTTALAISSGSSMCSNDNMCVDAGNTRKKDEKLENTANGVPTVLNADVFST